MQSLGFPSNWIVRPMIVLLAFAIALYLGAGLILQYWKVGIGISKAQRNDTDYSSGKEKMTCRSLDEVRTITIRLDNYTLDIQKRNVRLSNITKLSILKPLNTVFEPGVLNVIMGPSGSGKTSLLNLMARRLHSSISTRYETHGEIFFNGAIPSKKVIRSICSYVCQDDDALLPYLYVFSESMYSLLNQKSSPKTCLGSAYSLDVFQNSIYSLK